MGPSDLGPKLELEKSVPTTAGPSSSSSKANDISHLVKRKRKSDEVDPTDASVAKRPTP